MTLERSLRDLNSDKDIGHLSEADVQELICGLESRLSATSVALATEAPQASTADAREHQLPVEYTTTLPAQAVAVARSAS